jgi:hypothetical protein
VYIIAPPKLCPSMTSRQRQGVLPVEMLLVAVEEGQQLDELALPDRVRGALAR